MKVAWKGISTYAE